MISCSHDDDVSMLNIEGFEIAVFREVLAVRAQLVWHVKRVLLLRRFIEERVFFCPALLVRARQHESYRNSQTLRFCFKIRPEARDGESAHVSKILARVAKVQGFNYAFVQQDHARSAAAEHLGHSVGKCERVVHTGLVRLLKPMARPFHERSAVKACINAL